MKKLLLILLLTSVVSCENLHPNTHPFVVTGITQSNNQCLYEDYYYSTGIVDSCGKYRVGDTIKFIK